MDVTNSLKTTSLLELLSASYPAINYAPGDDFYWHPAEKTVYYPDDQIDSDFGKLQLLHETAHALLKHKDYDFDGQLIKIELAAWQKCQELAPIYLVAFEERYIQECLDSYRDWLHKRSTCIDCGQISLQIHPFLYKCFNCQASWRVPASPLCRRVGV
jgi:hypothetical protein